MFGTCACCLLTVASCSSLPSSHTMVNTLLVGVRKAWDRARSFSCRTISLVLYLFSSVYTHCEAAWDRTRSFSCRITYPDLYLLVGVRKAWDRTRSFLSNNCSLLVWLRVRDWSSCPKLMSEFIYSRWRKARDSSREACLVLSVTCPPLSRVVTLLSGGWTCLFLSYLELAGVRTARGWSRSWLVTSGLPDLCPESSCFGLFCPNDWLV